MTSMERMKIKSENLKLLVPLAALVIITPLLSTSLRFKYLYFIVNVLIISLGAEAGLLSFFLQSQHDHRKPASSLVVVPQITAIVSDNVDAVMKPVKDVVDKLSAAAMEPTIFFIEGCSESGDDDEEILMMEEANVEDHELYHKSETFIGNFYKQLKMQREESWDKLRGKKILGGDCVF